MATATRRSRRSSIDIWPGFVDALAQLLMVIIFVLLVFTAGQFYLSEALSGRDQALQQLQQQVDQLSDLLALERRSNEELRLGAADLTAQLQSMTAARDELTTRVAELAAKADQEKARADQATGLLQAANSTVSADKEKVELQLKELESLRRDLEALKTVRTELEAKVAALAAAQQQAQQDAGALRDRSKELQAQLASAQEKTALAQKQIDDRDVRLRDLGARAEQADKALTDQKKISSDAMARVQQLSSDIAALRDQLAKIGAALDASEAKVKDKDAQIVELGKRLNLALVNKVEELARYRSEFFGKVREAIGDRPDIRVVGDRFVFQSEVLFTPGNAELGDPAKKQLDPVIAALKDIAGKIPPDLNWILRVDGHTDKRPINTLQFASNWELSAARAISVVRYAIEKGIPADHIAAAGFADKQPLDPADSDEAYRRNRRIELKLTER
ncbi:MAG: peptidoglycan -binding protein [Alphaproteobacteria bacterium]|nr:peptidoglycan -binding protein [Alphaproteobacteria bacterium]